MNTLFLTENIVSYIALLVLALLIVVVGTQSKLSAAIGAPIGLLIGLYYLANGLGWHFIIMLLSAVAVMFMYISGNVNKK